MGNAEGATPRQERSIRYVLWVLCAPEEGLPTELLPVGEEQECLRYVWCQFFAENSYIQLQRC